MKYSNKTYSKYIHTQSACNNLIVSHSRRTKTYNVKFLTVVSPLGTVGVTPNDMSVNMNDTVTFTCQSMASPNLNFAWLINATTNASSNPDIVVNGPELTISNVTYLLGGRYTCVVTNMVGEGNDSSDLFGKL